MTSQAKRLRALRKSLDRRRDKVLLAAAPKSIELLGGESATWTNLEAAADDPSPKPPRFSMHAYTGGPMRVRGYQIPIVVDLQGMSHPTKSRPVLKDHDVSQVVGHTEGGDQHGVTISASDIFVSGVASGASPARVEVIEAAARGFSWQASIGAPIHAQEFLPEGKTKVVNGRAIHGPAVIATKTSLREISFVALGADDDTSTALAASQKSEEDMTFEKWLEAKGFVMAELAAPQLAVLRAAYDGEIAATSTPPAKPAAATPPAPAAVTAAATPAPEDTLSAMRTAAAGEIERTNAIARLCVQASSPTFEVGGAQVDLQAHAVRDGWSVERTELEILRAGRSSGPAIHSRGADDIDTSSIEAAFCLRNQVPEKKVVEWYGEKPTDVARSRRGRVLSSIHALYHHVIRAAGMYYPAGVVDDDFLRCAYRASQSLEASGYGAGQDIQASTGGISTLSLPTLLGNIANKTLLAAYQSVPTEWQNFCSTADHSNFHTYTKARMTGNAQMLQLGADGEIKHFVVGEESYTNKLKTYARMATLSREDQINDDLNAFLGIPRMIGLGAARAIEEAFFSLLNAAALFTLNTNYFEGAATAFDIDGLSLMAEKFLSMLDPNGKPLLVQYSKLLVPTNLIVSAREIAVSTQVNETTTANKRSVNNNPHAGTFEPRTSAYLNVATQDAFGQTVAAPAAGATIWYAFASNPELAAYEAAFLQGRQQPVIESGEMNFNVLGGSWRGYWDFGVAEQNPKGVVKFKGAA